MSDKNQNPDRAGSYDADGLDVPTYRQDAPAADQPAGSTAASARPSVRTCSCGNPALAPTRASCSIAAGRPEAACGLFIGAPGEASESNGSAWGGS